MSRAIPTLEELIETIKRSKLPTVLVEGSNDARVYRGLEELLGSLNASFLDCGGRRNLLAIFDRRTELNAVRVCFVADKDMWIFDGTPPELAEVVFSDGYSIENDAYQDANVERLLKSVERANHAIIIDELAKWLAFQVEEYRAGRPFRSDPHHYHLIPAPGFTCSPAVLAEHGFHPPDPALLQEIRSEYKRKFRGKLLFDVIVRFSHAKDREPRHSYASLIDIAVAFGAEGPRINALLEGIKARLSASPPLPGLN